MERVKSTFSKASLLATLALLVSAPPALPGTILMPPPAPKDPAASREEEFAESAFGRGPAAQARLDAEADRRIETPDSRWNEGQRARMLSTLDSDGGGRSPASVVARPTELEALAARRKGVQEVALIAGDLGFFPKTVFVTRDIPVRMFVTGASRSTLCLMMDSFQVRKQVRSQKIEEITFTPGTPGKYRFYCPVNGMEGTLIVKELAGI